MHIHVFFTMSKYLLVGGNEDTKKGCQKPHNGNLGHTILFSTKKDIVPSNDIENTEQKTKD